MASSSPIRVQVKQGQPATLTARVRDLDGAYILQSTISAISYAVYDLRTTYPFTTSVASTSLTVASVVFNTLQVSAVLFPVDGTGYNFKFKTTQTAFPNALSGQAYLVIAKFTQTADGLKFTTEWLCSPVIPVASAPL